MREHQIFGSKIQAEETEHDRRRDWNGERTKKKEEDPSWDVVVVVFTTRFSGLGLYIFLMRLEEVVCSFIVLCFYRVLCASTKSEVDVCVRQCR